MEIFFGGKKKSEPVTYFFQKHVIFFFRFLDRIQRLDGHKTGLFFLRFPNRSQTVPHGYICACDHAQHSNSELPITQKKKRKKSSNSVPTNRERRYAAVRRDVPRVARSNETMWLSGIRFRRELHACFVFCMGP